ncbi:MAG TPA: hypothetical protein VMM93_06975 [Vicinamibacterales bacterium]|nr:hypothetical protein [Vicinamibacterales bacterium]
MRPGCRLPAACLLATLVTAVPAEAQQSTRRPLELSGGIVWTAPRALGSVDANLLDADGTPVPFFRADIEAGAGLGLEVIVSQAVARRIDVELSGGWTRFDVRTVIRGDIEDVPDVTVSEALSRYSVEGGVAWRFAEQGRLAWFLRGSAGWMREVVGDMSLAENGLVFGGGLGFKYWMARRATGQDQFGIRVEMRVLNRRDGIPLDDGGFRLWPAAAASAVVKF